MITKNKFLASFILCHYAICIICTYSCSDNQKRFQEENADCKTETLKIKKNIPLEDFSVFIEKFHKDKEFQKNAFKPKLKVSMVTCIWNIWQTEMNMLTR